MRVDRWLVPALLATLACGSTPTPTPPVATAARQAVPAAPKPRRKAVAGVVVDQLAAWVLEMHASEWAQAKLGDPACRGFCRLMREGTYAPRMEYAHAITDTAPGHATLYTGMPPHDHGIIQNEKLVVDALGKPHNAGSVYDAKTRLVGPNGVTDIPGASLALLRVPTIADELRAKEPDACIVSVSLKDRGAVFGGGRSPTATVFYEPALRSFVTSTAFAPTFPAAATLAYAPGTLETRIWSPLDAGWLKQHAPTADDQPGEGDYHGLGTVFPHALGGGHAADPSPAGAYRMTPFGDEDVRTVGRNLLALCKDKATTFVTLSFSSHDYVLHTFGAHSWEAFDELERLDRTLAGWLDDLDAAFGHDGWSLALSADHGSTPLPELALAKRPWCAAGAPNPWDLPCAPGVRLGAGALYNRLDQRADRELGKGPWIAGVTDPRIILTPRAKQLPPAKYARLVAALKAELMATGGVEAVVDLPLPAGPCGPEPLGDHPPDLVKNSVCWAQAPFEPGSIEGDLYVVVKKGSFFDAGYTLGKGESHGSPWLYDRAVPFLARSAFSGSPKANGENPGPGSPRNVVRPEPVSYREFAHTLRGWLGLAN